MSLSTVPSKQARAEAADWFARLNKLDVPYADMQAFKAWMLIGENKKAYDEVDAFWRRSEALKDDPDIKAAISGALDRTAPRPPAASAPARRGRGYGLAFALALMVAVGGGYSLWGPRFYSTGVGEQRTIQLADGSTVMLDTDSRVAVRLTGARRDIRLTRGQALFDVAHDAARPFVVTAGDTSVKALGTRFDVRREAQGAQVTLVRGAVEVRSQSGGTPLVWRLSPGQGVSTTQAAPRPAPVDVALRTSWTSGRLVFNDVPLAAAVAEINRYNKTRIVVDAGPRSPARISGTFDVGDTDYFVSSAAALNDFTIDRSEPGVIRLTRGSQVAKKP